MGEIRIQTSGGSIPIRCINAVNYLTNSVEGCFIDFPPSFPDVNSHSIDFPYSLAILKGIVALGSFRPR